MGDSWGRCVEWLCVTLLHTQSMGAWIPALVSEYLKMSMDVFVFPRLRAQGLLRMYVLFGLSWASLVAP